MKVRGMFVPALAAGLLSLTVLSNAQTFAQQNTTTQRPFEFLNSGTQSTSGLTTTGNASAAAAGTMPVTFYFTDSAPLLGYTGPTGPINSIFANLTINNAVVTAPTSGLTVAGNYDTNLTDTTSGPTFIYTVAGTQTVGGMTFNNGADLLSVFLAGGNFQFSAEGTTGRTANIIQSTGAGGTLVTYASDFLNLTNQRQQTVSYAFNDATAQNNVNANGVLNTNTYNGTGIFSLNIPASQTPEPGAIAMLVGMGVSGSAFVLRRRRANK